MIYSQTTGKLYTNEGKLIDIGHAGHGEGLNNPDMQNVHNIGPICEGWYTILAPIDSPNTGPYSLPLIPDTNNKMYGRSGFYMHGGLSEPFKRPDGEIIEPGQESDGCIIFPFVTRKKVWIEMDHRLQVIK